MNLGRAKSILIIAFICLNLFLGYHLFWPDFGRLTRVAVTAEQVRMTEAMLNQNNYFLETTLDRAIQTSDFITVSPASDIQIMIMERLIEEDSIFYEQENAKVYRQANEMVVFGSSGLIQISFDPGVFLAENSANIEQRELRSKIEQFLNEKRFMPEGLAFDYIRKVEPDSMILHYYQVLDNVPIYAGQLKVTVKLDYIVEIEIYWLEPLERSPAREMEVISATEALANLIKELGPSIEPRKVKQIDLGYFSGEFDAEKWEIPPVWRIVLDEQQIYYVNAFTGNLEQDIIIPEPLP